MCIVYMCMIAFFREWVKESDFDGEILLRENSHYIVLIQYNLPTHITESDFFVVAVLNRVVSLFIFWELRRVISLFLSFCQSSSSSSGLDVTAAALTASAKSSLLACKRSPERLKK